MIHEIFPHKLDIQFRIQAPKPEDFLIVYEKGKTLLKKEGDNFFVPHFYDFSQDFLTTNTVAQSNAHYLFNIDGRGYFLFDGDCPEIDASKFQFCGNRTFRTLEDHCERLGGAVASHIAHWESLNKHCGACGNLMERSKTERAMVCPHCKNTVYPRISPVVIVAVSDGDKLLMAHNRDNPNPRRFLISGFVEVGESLEQAVAREVKEEVGINVKNIRYFASQPWPFSDSMIAGFTAELDGDPTIHMQEDELSEALWVKREDIPPYETDVSISCCLIENFRKR